MANTAVVYARIDSNLKKEVDEILNELQVSPAALIRMLYVQIKLTRSIPFEFESSSKNLVFINELNREELNNEFSKGLNDIKKGNIYTAEETKKILLKNIEVK